MNITHSAPQFTLHPVPLVPAGYQAAAASDRVHDVIRPVGGITSDDGVQLHSRQARAGVSEQPSNLASKAPNESGIDANANSNGSDIEGSSHESQIQKQGQAKKAAQERQALLDKQEIQELAARDREVRAHEQAHMAVGGQYAGAASYTYERGPNGVNYAVGGEVPISTGEESTPELTLRKAQIVRRAALAPAEPSPADRQVAAAATRLEAQARQEIAQIQQREANEEDEKRASLQRESRVSDSREDTPGASSEEELAISVASPQALNTRVRAYQLPSAANQIASGGQVSQFA